MIKPEIPLNETARLVDLQSLRLLDTHPEERFDRITRLARRVFDVEISLLSLVDRDRQWFKSRQGTELRETPRDLAFCAHAINDEEPLVVSDARRDFRFHDNPLVLEAPHIRFYAGCPVRGPSGNRVGTLCLIDSAPKSLSAEDAELLQELGRMVEEEFAALALATTDDLTRLANRRGFRLVAAHVMPLALRQNLPVALVHIDLDNLKTVNDAQGHDAGDQMLRDFARLLLKNFRDADVASRFGGDEFCLLTSGADRDQVESCVLRLSELAAANRPNAIRFSAGVAMHDPGRHRDLDAFLDDADDRMYVAKNRKRARAERTSGAR